MTNPKDMDKCPKCGSENVWSHIAVCEDCGWALRVDAERLAEALLDEKAALNGLIDRNTHIIQLGQRQYHAIEQIRSAVASLDMAVSFLGPVDG